MGASIDLFVNNNLFENDITYTLEKLKDKTQCDIDIFGNYFENNSHIENKDSLHLYLDDAHSINEYFEKERHIQLFRTNGMDEEEILLSRNNVNLRGEKFDISGEFYSFCSFVNGSKYTNYNYNQMINDIIEYSKIFESNKLIIFSGDFHGDILERLWYGDSIEEIIIDKRWEIIKEDNITLKDLEDIGEENINYLYYKEWKFEKDFNIVAWKNYFR